MPLIENPHIENPTDRVVAEPSELISAIDDLVNLAPMPSPPASAAPAAVENASTIDPFYGWAALWASNDNDCQDCCAETNELTWEVDEDGLILLESSLGCSAVSRLQTPDVAAAVEFVLELASHFPIGYDDVSANLHYEVFRLRSAAALRMAG